MHDRTMVLLTAIETASAAALRARGVRSSYRITPRGRLRWYDGKGGGELPPVVFLHGLASSAASFAATMLRVLPEVRRVVTLDLPGHGKSPPSHGRNSTRCLLDAVRDTLAHELHEPALLVGNSLGGGLALRCALESPDRVLGLVLSSPAGAPLSAQEHEDIARAFRITSTDHGIEFFQRLYHSPPPLVRWFASELQSVVEQPHLRELILSLKDAELPSSEQLQTLTQPGLVLWGESDQLMPRSALAYLRRHLPNNVHFEELEDVGHSPHTECPDRFAHRILDFARRLPAAPIATPR